MKIAVIEDDPLVAEQLSRILRRVVSESVILPAARTVEEAIKMLNEHTDIELVFSDIELVDGRLCFEILTETRCTAPIVFCTAYQEYALRAFDSLAIDYILKPFDEADIRNAIEKLKSIQRPGTAPVEIPQAEVGWESPVHLVVNVGGRVIVLQTRDIALVAREQGNTFVYTHDQRKYYTSHSLEDLERMLGEEFFRATRQQIISRNAVSEARHVLQRKLVVIPSIKYKGKILVSKLRKTSLLRWLRKS